MYDLFTGREHALPCRLESLLCLLQTQAVYVEFKLLLNMVPFTSSCELAH